MFYICRLVLRQMKLQPKGSIVNAASIFDMGGAPDAHIYTATKGAIINLTKSMSVAYVDDNIRYNVAAPGLVKTQMVESVLDMLCSPENPQLVVPMGRPATTEEVAYACLYLASGEASYCTGTVLAVDGDRLRRISDNQLRSLKRRDRVLAGRERLAISIARDRQHAPPKISPAQRHRLHRGRNVEINRTRRPPCARLRIYHCGNICSCTVGAWDRPRDPDARLVPSCLTINPIA